jgi:hypothetical protein
MREAGVGKQRLRQAARLAASEVCAKRRREPAERDRRLEKLAIEVLTVLGERDVTTIAATEQRAGAALQAMITMNLDGVGGGEMVRRSNRPP